MTKKKQKATADMKEYQREYRKQHKDRLAINSTRYFIRRTIKEHGIEALNEILEEVGVR